MNRIAKTAVELTLRNTGCRPVFARRCTTSSTSSSSSSSSGSPSVKDVPGLSKNTVDVPLGDVGFPGASKKGTYKNPEYFCYHNTSYFEAEVEMQKYRLPQPSNKLSK